MQGEDDDSMPGQDSFIDVVCNMVGILIILVMVMAIRGRDVLTPQLMKAAESAVGAAASALGGKRPAPADQREFEAAQRRLAETSREIQMAQLRAADLRVGSEVIEARRRQLAIVQAAVEKDIAERRARLGGDGQEQFDVQRKIVESEIRLNELNQQQLAAITQSVEVEEVECVPTPLARTVTGEEIHVRLRRGQLAIVPVDELLEEVRRRGGDHLRSGLQSRNAASEVYGPINGFRMKLFAERFETSLPGQSALDGPQRPTVVLQGAFLPTSDDLGQTLEQALLPDSEFMRTLRSRRASAPTVTTWVYPDSYGELRALKRTLWEAGVPLAVRPLADGQPITFSTAGTKSSAQ
jgi:hypothetical protein